MVLEVEGRECILFTGLFLLGRLPNSRRPHSYELPSTCLVNPKEADAVWGPNTTPTKNPMSILNMALESIMLTVAHMDAGCKGLGDSESWEWKYVGHWLRVRGEWCLSQGPEVTGPDTPRTRTQNGQLPC